MSTEDAKKFLDEVNDDARLRARLLGAGMGAQSWVSEAASKGYEVTVDELRAVAEGLVGRPISAEALAGQLRSLFEGELGDESLDAVTGGAGVPARKLRVQTTKPSGGGGKP
ncbi:MAG: Nif11-like leader peptide family natural product precursor [Labilithrix sp.]|nr:Nif11-like leader peptide family natural product precursor [Labilithrix sp.]MCW5810482.1 Nif11-like leader peptide family natural product precursor [Labilithrix sp.]